MAAEDWIPDHAFEDSEPDEDEDNYYPRNAYRFQCKYCGCAKLTWKYRESGWRLFDKQNQIHSCKGKENGQEHCSVPAK